MRNYQDVVKIESDNEVFVAYRDIIEILPSDDVVTDDDYSAICDTVIKRCFSVNSKYCDIKSVVYSTQIGLKKNFIIIMVNAEKNNSNSAGFYYNVVANFVVSINKKNGYTIFPFNFYFAPGINVGLRLYNDSTIHFDSFVPVQDSNRTDIKYSNDNKNEFAIVQVGNDFFNRDPLRSVHSQKDRVMIEFIADIWGVLKSIDFFGSIDFCGFLCDDKTNDSDVVLPSALDKIFLVKLLRKDKNCNKNGHSFIVFCFDDSKDVSDLSSVSPDYSFNISQIISANKCFSDFLKNNNIQFQGIKIDSSESFFNMVFDKLKIGMSHKYYGDFFSVAVNMPISKSKVHSSVIEFAKNELPKGFSDRKSCIDSDLCSGGVDIVACSDNKRINVSVDKVKNTENIVHKKSLANVGDFDGKLNVSREIKDMSILSGVENIKPQKTLSSISQCDNKHSVAINRSDSSSGERVVVVKKARSAEGVRKRKEISVFDKPTVCSESLKDRPLSDLPLNNKLNNVSLECIGNAKLIQRAVSCD